MCYSLGMEDQNVVIDGFIYTPDGECIGWEPEWKNTPDSFKIENESGCEWVLEKFLDEEAKLAALDKTAAVIRAKALLANVAEEQRRLHSRLDWLHRRWDNELMEYAKTKFKGNSKTHKTLFGKISVRTVPIRLMVTDKNLALNLALRRRWDNAIKTIPESHEFQISGLLPEQVETLKVSPPDGFDVVPAREVVKVDTGVEK